VLDWLLRLRVRLAGAVYQGPHPCKTVQVWLMYLIIFWMNFLMAID
jgi:hypothetical protein